MLVNFNSKDNFGPFSSPVLTSTHTGAETPRSTAGSPASLASSVLDSVSDRLRRDSATSTAASSYEGRSLPVPVLPEEFFAVLDAAKFEAYTSQLSSQAPPAPRTGAVGRLGLGLEGDPGSEGPGGAWFNWRDLIPTGDSDDDDDDVEEEELGEGEEAESTPRPRAGPRFLRPRQST